MSNIDDTYASMNEAKTAAFISQHRDFTQTFTAQGLAKQRPTDAGIPFSGDYLGTFSNLEQVYTPGVGVEPGEEVSRERIHRADVNVWDMVAA